MMGSQNNNDHSCVTLHHNTSAIAKPGYCRITSGEGVLWWLFWQRLSIDQRRFWKQKIGTKKSRTQRSNYPWESRLLCSLPSSFSDKPLFLQNLCYLPSFLSKPNHDHITWCLSPFSLLPIYPSDSIGTNRGACTSTRILRMLHYHPHDRLAIPCSRDYKPLITQCCRSTST